MDKYRIELCDIDEDLEKLHITEHKDEIVKMITYFNNQRYEVQQFFLSSIIVELLLDTFDDETMAQGLN